MMRRTMILLFAISLVAWLVMTPVTAGSQESSPTFRSKPATGWTDGFDFAPNASVTITIKGAPGGTVLWSGDRPTDESGNWSTSLGGSVGMHLVPGMEITVTDGASTKVLKLVALTIHSVDPTYNTISGTAPAGAHVTVGAGGASGEEYLQVLADDAGDWVANFSGVPELEGATWALARVFDEDLDNVEVNWAPPTFRSKPATGGTDGWYFAPNASVTITIKDAPGGTVLWSGDRPTDESGNWSTSLGWDLVPGMEMTVTDGASTKVLELVALTIHSVDLTSDTISGTAPAGAQVTVGAGGASGDAYLQVPADGGGDWVANFSGVLELEGATWAWAKVSDEDGDEVEVDWPPPAAAHSRSVTLSMSGSLTASGRVQVDEGLKSCRSGVHVDIQKKTTHGWRTLKTVMTTNRGEFRTSVPGREGRYRAVALEEQLGDPPTDTCSRAVSVIEKVR